MRLTLVISTLGCGGAERVISIMANYWAQRGEEVTLLTFDRGRQLFYPLHAAIQHRALGLVAESNHILVGFVRNLYRMIVLRRGIRDFEPSVVISFMEKNNILTLLATRGLGIPVIISERTDPSAYDIGQIWNMLRRLTYRFADALVCQSPATLARVSLMVGINGVVIPNPVVLTDPTSKRDASLVREKRKHIIVAMGRLVEEKGFDLLLSAFGRISQDHPDWSVTIMGEGPMRKELENQAKCLGLKDRVNFAGQTADPFPVLRQADLFVLSSRFEGFPNALCEAMACGLAVVSFDCCSGPREIIRDGVDGVLVPAGDVNALAATLDRLMRDSAERERLATCAPNVLERFGVDRIMGMWEAVLSQAASEKAARRSLINLWSSTKPSALRPSGAEREKSHES